MRPIQNIIRTGQAQTDRFEVGYSGIGRLVHIKKMI
jgi:hypothetical protein